MELPLLILTLAAAVVVLGIGLILVARRGRRVDDHPVCRRCGYDLVGRPAGSDRCAECGADLRRRRAVRIGNRLPRRGLFWAGLSVTSVAIVLCAGIGWLLTTSIDLTKHKPVWMLRGEATNSAAAKRAPAVAELTRRFTAGELSEEQIQALILDALTLQPDANFPWTEWGGLVNKLFMAGKIRDPEWIQFVRQAVRPRLLTRQKVRAGDPMPVTLVLDTQRLPHRDWTGPIVGVGRLPTPPAVVQFDWMDIQLLGATPAGFTGRQGRYPNAITPTYVDGVRFDEMQTTRFSLGTHSLMARVKVHVLSRDESARIASFDVDVLADVTILSADTDPTMFFVSDPSLKEGIVNAIWRVEVTGVARGQVTNMYVLQLSMSDPPVGLAHQAFLRAADGREFAFGSITFGNRGNGGSNRYARAELGDATTVDVILRPDYQLVAQSTRSDAIWGEEIIFKAVQVMPRGTPIRSGGLPPASRRARRGSK